MVIIIHSAESKGSIADKIGGMDYSYYFVLKKYRPVLEKFAFVIEIRDPASEVDAIYRNCQARGEPCLFYPSRRLSKPRSIFNALRYLYLPGSI